MTEEKKTPTKKEVKEEKPSAKVADLSLESHEMKIQIEDLKLAVTSLTKGLKGVYEEIDNYSQKLNKVADRLGL